MTPENNIYKALKRNRAITIGAIVIACVTIVSAFVFAFSVYTYQMNHALTIDQSGDLLPLKYIDINESYKIEAAHHIEMFHRYFYSYDKSSFKTQIDKALWLADETAENIYLLLQNEKWFERVVQFNIIQDIEIHPGNILIETDKLPFIFRASSIVRIGQFGKVNSYQLETSGAVTKVHRNYPLNPHGLLITEFKEIGKLEVKDE